jgi:hypothetical protein
LKGTLTLAIKWNNRILFIIPALRNPGFLGFLLGFLGFQQFLPRLPAGGVALDCALARSSSIQKF